MKAVIMAGGAGQRLKPLTCDLPKPMVPLLNRPVMEYSVELLKRHNIDMIATTLQYLPDVVTRHFGDGSGFGVEMRHFIEDKPLGTAGSVRQAAEFLNETFVVLSGDAITDADLTAAAAFHREKGAIATLLLKSMEIPLEYGVVITDKNGRITRFLEKPGWGEVFSDTVNTGIYILEPEVFEHIAEGKPVDFSKDVFPRLLELGLPMYAYVTDDYWCDIGSPPEYLRAHRDLLDGKCRVYVRGSNLNGIWFEGEPFTCDAEAPAFIGKDAVIESGAHIGPYAVLGRGCRIMGGTVCRSVLWDNVLVENEAYAGGAIICSDAEIGEKAEIREGAVIGARSVIGERTRVFAGASVWPDKHIECGTEVRDNVVWGELRRRLDFGAEGISGVVNVNISPEDATKLSSAAAAALGGGIAVAHDGSEAGVMLALAACAGAAAAGSCVETLGEAVLPVFALAIRALRLKGGIYVYGRGPRHVIAFLDEQGLKAPRKLEKKIIELFDRSEYKRAGVGAVLPRAGMLENYIQTIAAAVDAEAIARERYKIAVSAEGAVAKAAAALLRELGCETVFADGDIAEAVRKHGCAMGFELDALAEELRVCDEEGVVPDEAVQAAIPYVLQIKLLDAAKLALPVGTPDVLARLAREHDKEVVESRAKNSEAARLSIALNALCAPESEFLHGLCGDALFKMATILHLLSAQNMGMAEFIAEIPEFHSRAVNIDCRYRDIGRVIREMHENGEIKTEGVRVERDGGWAVILPDAGRAGLKVISHGMSEEYANEIADFYAEKIKEIMKEK